MTTIPDISEKSPNADISDHEAKAREILESCKPTKDDHPSLFHAIASALREAEAGERREIMNLLGMDENGDGLTTTSSWLTSDDEDAGHKEITICHDPYYELEGALDDLRRQGADKVCISTIEKVQAQLAAVSKRAAAIRSRNDE